MCATGKVMLQECGPETRSSALQKLCWLCIYASQVANPSALRLRCSIWAVLLAYRFFPQNYLNRSFQCVFPCVLHNAALATLEKSNKNPKDRRGKRYPPVLDYATLLGSMERLHGGACTGAHTASHTKQPTRAHAPRRPALCKTAPLARK